MLHDVIVPLDGSPEALVALGPAATMAHYLGSEVSVIGCYADDDEKSDLASVLPDQLNILSGTKYRLQLEPVEGTVGQTIGAIVAQSPGRLVAMTTKGRGRTAALLGSVAVDILDNASGPLLLLGPNYEEGRFRCHGPLMVATPSADYSRADSWGRAVLPTAEAFGLTFDFDLELDMVHDPYLYPAIDPLGAAVPLIVSTHGMEHDLCHLAVEVGEVIGRPVDKQVLKGAGVGRALVKRAEELAAAAVVMATDNPTGLSRLLLGSVTSDVIRRAPCAVIVVHPHPPVSPHP